MSTDIVTKQHKSYDLGMESDSSSQISSQNNKQRMKSLKALSTKKDSFINYVNNTTQPSDIKMQSATLFQSERWNFKPHTLTYMDDFNKNKRDSVKTDEQNPFKRAKQDLLNKNNNGSNMSISGKSKDEEDLNDTEQEMTTFRLIKRGSLNVNIQRVSIKQL